jgi:hypothetical protein
MLVQSRRRNDNAKEAPMKRIGLLISGLAVSLALVGFAVAGASDKKSTGFGNHTLKGMYEFHADGVVEVDGVPTRGFWEVGSFEADGKGNIPGA